VQQTLKDLAAYDQRASSAAPAAEPEPGIPNTPGTPDSGAPAVLTGAPPFDALLLADTGDTLTLLTSFFASYGIVPPAVRVLGPALWADPGTRAGAMLDGAWYAAPDPQARAPFSEAYSERFGSDPPGLADLAYDAAGIARVTAAGGYALAALTNPAGFPGADGLLALEPGGQVRRGLAVFEIHGSGTTVVQPAPTSLAAPGL
jgi:hypothetical protein